MVLQVDIGLGLVEMAICVGTFGGCALWAGVTGSWVGCLVFFFGVLGPCFAVSS